MAGATTRGGFPYPAPTDPDDVPADIQRLAERLAAVGMLFAPPSTAALRPAAGTANRVHFATDTRQLSFDDGTSWTTLPSLLTDVIWGGAQSFRDAVEFRPEPANLFPTQFEPAGTNLVTNPSIEVDATGWRNQTAVNGTVPGATVVRDTAQAFIGTASLRTDIVAGPYSPAGAMYQGPTWVMPVGDLTPGTTISARVKVRFSVADRSGAIVLRGRNADLVTGPTFGVTSVAFANLAANVWHDLTATVTLTAGATQVELVAWENRADQGAYSVWVDAAQIEVGPVATSYIDGTRGTGYAWTGVAHASTSTRAANTVAVQPTDVATTNLVPTPSFEAGLGIWGSTADFGGYGGGGGVVSRARGGRVGDWSARVDVSAGANFHGIWHQASRIPVAPGTYTLSAWVRVEGSVPKTIQTVHEGYSSATGATQVANSVSAINHPGIGGEWTRVTHTFTYVTGTTHTTLQVRNLNGDQGAFTFFVDGIQLEAGGGTSYADGSLGTGYAWTGTPHASTSTRAAGTPIPPIVQTPPPHGTVVEAEGRNAVVNPTFARNLDGWTTYNGATAVRDTSTSAVGAASARVSVPAGPGNAAIRSLLNDSRIQGGQPLTASVWVRTATAKNITLLLRSWTEQPEVAGSGSANTVAFLQHTTRAGEWTRLSVTGTPVVGDTRAWVIIHNNATDQGAYDFWVSGAQIEHSPVATSFISGDLGPGYSWEGTPYASPSRRTAGAKVIGTSGRATITALELPGAQSAFVGPQESTTSGGYINGTSVVQVTVNIGPSGRALVMMGAAIWSEAAGGYSIMTYGVLTPSGAVVRTTEALEERGMYSRSAAAPGYDQRWGVTDLIVGLPPGPLVFRLAQRSGGGTAHYARRSLTVIPL